MVKKKKRNLANQKRMFFTKTHLRKRKTTASIQIDLIAKKSFFLFLSFSSNKKQTNKQNKHEDVLRR